MKLIELVERGSLILRWPSALLRSIKLVDDFCYHTSIRSTSLVVDVGCADQPQVGLYFAKHGHRVILVDPTLKHKKRLKEIEQNWVNITHLQHAVGLSDGSLKFYEPFDKTSGSLLVDHKNSKTEGIEYLVSVVGVRTLLKYSGENNIGLLKLDLEGAEYDLINGSDNSTWHNIDQLFVEFHHHCTSYTYNDTLDCIAKFKGFGFNCFKLHNDVFLFYRV